MSINKSVTPSQYTPGTTSSVNYTVTAFNAGPDTATGATITDTPPAGLTIGSWTCAASVGSGCPASGSGPLSAVPVTLAANGSAVFTLQASVSPSATGTLSNKVTITPPVGLPDPDMSNNQATANLAPGVAPAIADLSINKSVTPTQYVPGTASSLTYSYALVTDTPDSGLVIGNWTCTSSTGTCPPAGSGALVNVPVSLSLGGSATFLVTATVTGGATGIQTNTVTVTPPNGTTDPDPDPSNNTNIAAISPDGTPTTDLQLTKSVTPLSYTPGVTNSLTYTIAVQNNGPTAVTGASVSDTPDLALVLGTWSCIASSGASCPATGNGNLSNVLVNLPAGAQVVFTLNASIPNGTLGSLLNSATITPPVGIVDSDTATNTGSAVATQNPAQTNLRIQKTASISSYIQGVATSLTYTVQVFNDGPLNVVGAFVNDTLPTGLVIGNWTCTSASGTCPATGSGALNSVLVNLPVGASATFSINASIDAAASGGLLNTASIAPPVGVTDSNPANNTSSATIGVAPQADLLITKTASINNYAAGQPLTYTLVVSNNGPSAVTAATVSDLPSAGITLSSWTCTATGSVTCPASGSGALNNVVVDLPVSGSVTFVVNASVAVGATGTITNMATVTPPAGIIDNNPPNNSASAIITNISGPGPTLSARAIPALSHWWMLVLAFSLAGIGFAQQRSGHRCDK